MLRLIFAFENTNSTGHSGIIVTNARYHSIILSFFLLGVPIYTSQNYYFNTSCYKTVMDMHFLIFMVASFYATAPHFILTEVSREL